MKADKTTLIQRGILVVLACAVVASIALTQIFGRESVREIAELSVIFRETQGEICTNMRLGMEQAAQDYGGELRFLTPTAQNDSAQQQVLIRREVERGAHALILVPAAPEQQWVELDAAVGMCAVVSMESPLQGAAAQVLPDNAALGALLAEAVIADWTGGCVLLLDTGGQSTGVRARLDGAKNTLLAHGIEIAQRTCHASELTNVLDTLVQQTDAALIISFDAATSEQAIAAKSGAGFPQPIYGVGMSAAIAAAMEREAVVAVVAWSEYVAGYLAVQQAISAINAQPCGDEQMPFYLLRREDIYEPDIQKLFFPVTS